MVVQDWREGTVEDTEQGIEAGGNSQVEGYFVLVEEHSNLLETDSGSAGGSCMGKAGRPPVDCCRQVVDRSGALPDLEEIHTQGTRHCSVDNRRTPRLGNALDGIDLT